MPTRTYRQTRVRGRVAHGRPHLTVVRTEAPHAEPRGRFGTDLRGSGCVAALQLTDELEARAERLASLQARAADAPTFRWMGAAIRINATLVQALARASAAATRDVLNA
jgi:hypothetical protein